MRSNASLSVVLKGWREGASPTKSIYQPFVSTVGRFPPVSLSLLSTLSFRLSHVVLFLRPFLLLLP